jgi:hypothetical protein
MTDSLSNIESVDSIKNSLAVFKEIQIGVDKMIVTPSWVIPYNVFVQIAIADNCGMANQYKSLIEVDPHTFELAKQYNPHCVFASAEDMLLEFSNYVKYITPFWDSSVNGLDKVGTNKSGIVHVNWKKETQKSSMATVFDNLRRRNAANFKHESIKDDCDDACDEDLF